MFLWIKTEEADPPHSVTHEEKLISLIESLSSGWNTEQPVLLAYRFKDRIQLISGSHRWAAAKILSQLIPIKLYDYSTIYDIWGTDNWISLVKNPPLLKECESYEGNNRVRGSDNLHTFPWPR